jgi:hypothetical protein
VPEQRKEGKIVNRFALAAVLAIGLSGIAQAKLIELVPEPPAGVGAAGVRAAGVPAPQPRAGADSAAKPAFALPSGISELPEPEVFAMMLVGLVLLGYRARRDSSEKFT